MGCAVSVAKYLVLIFNLIFVLCGLGVIIYGVVLKVQYKQDVTIAPIVFGAVVFLIAFFGCCGTIRESRCMLITFAVILIILFLISLIFGIVLILVMANQSEAYAECKDQVRSYLYNFERNKDKSALEEHQKLFQCCGLEGPQDFNTDLLPLSCCQNEKLECRKDDPDVNEIGCMPMCDLFYYVLQIMGVVIIVVAFVELSGSICAICLANAIENQWRRGAYA